MIKKIILATVAAAIAITALGGCDLKGKNRNMAVVVPTELSKPYDQIIKIVGPDKDVNLFNLKLPAKTESMKVWVEYYDHGKVRASMPSMELDFDSKWEVIILMIDNAENGKLTVSAANKNFSEQSLLSADLKKPSGIDESYLRGQVTLSAETKAAFGSEIVLSCIVYDNRKGMALYDTEYYTENPEVIKSHGFAILVKCAVYGAAVE